MVFRAEKVTGKNLSLTILRAVLLVAEKKNFTVRATNLDLGIEIQVPAQITNEGVVAVPGDILNSFLANNPNSSSVVLSTKDGVLEVATERSVARVKTLPHEDFPTIPKPKQTNTISLPSKDLASGLRAVWYAASPSSMKPELSSVLVVEERGDVVFAATDSFRLAEKRLRVKGVDSFSPLLIPLKNITEIVRTLDQAGDVATLQISENQLSVIVGETYLTTRIIDATFPDYKQIIPTSFTTEATVLKDDLVNTLKISTIFSNKFNQVLFNISPKKKQFTVETNNPEIGENTTKVEAALVGEELAIGFNHKYITDSFQSLTADSTTLKFSGEGKPLVIQGVGDKTFTYLVMPMNR
ncbi:DNA polymerase III subunit beta [Candidatus Wolfebacteria bacterium]|nr:DNA polymerase III subunit beta [Candidatus Wolfebacteria bacterium]